jgi:hypothetical protein
MRKVIANIRTASGQTVEIMTGMFTEVIGIGVSFNTINSAVEAQASNNSRILNALTALKETTEIVKTGSAIYKKRSGVIQKTFEQLKAVSIEVNVIVSDVEDAAKKSKLPLKQPAKQPKENPLRLTIPE